MSTNLTKQKEALLNSISSCSNLQELEEIRVQIFGKNGIATNAMKNLANLSLDEKKEMGKNLNLIKNELQNFLNSRKTEIAEKELEEKLKNETQDLSLPIRDTLSFENYGKIHPISQVKEEICSILASFGLKLEEGPDIEDEKYNFDSLNFPENHPSRQMHDSFFMPKKGKVLRTHTSPIQVRTMEKSKPPFRIAALGKTFRCDSDATHVPMFHQVEGLVVDENINMGHLKTFLIEFLKAFFEIDEAPIRFRSSFFPFTEPSVEVDVLYENKNGQISIGQGNEWLEILGCGMVHPNVLKAAGVDSEKYQGFAFGMGVERLAMMKYGINDLRKLFENDLRFNQHYGFSSFDIPNLIWGLTR